jgi:predicted MFS family arabinose efflux permease
MTMRLGLVTAILAVGQIVGWGTTFYLPGIIGRDMARDLALSSEAAYGGITVMVVTSAVLSPIVGRWLDRYGTRWFMACGSLLMAGGLAALSQVTSLAGYLAAWGLIGVASVFCLSLPATTTLAQVAGPAARRSMVVLMLFTGLSSSVVWPITAFLEPMLGWRMICLVYAAAHLLIAFPLHAFGLPDRSFVVSAGDAKVEPVAGAIPLERRTIAFAAVAAAFSLSGFVSWGLSLHIIELLHAGGLREPVAVALGSMMGLLQVSARVFEFLLGNRVSPVASVLVSTALLPLSFAVFLLGMGSPPAAIAFLTLYAVATGLIAVGRATLPLWLFGAATYGSASGRLMLAQNIAFGLAPVVFAAALDAGLRTALALALVSGLASLAAMVVVARVARQTAA